MVLYFCSFSPFLKGRLYLHLYFSALSHDSLKRFILGKTGFIQHLLFLTCGTSQLLLLPVCAHFIAKRVYSDAKRGLLFIKPSSIVQMAPSWLSVHCSHIVGFLFRAPPETPAVNPWLCQVFKTKRSQHLWRVCLIPAWLGPQWDVTHFCDFISTLSKPLRSSFYFTGPSPDSPLTSRSFMV